MTGTGEWAVVVMLKRPLNWQTETNACYGPMTKTEMWRFCRDLPQYNIHHVIAYELQTRPGPFLPTPEEAAA